MEEIKYTADIHVDSQIKHFVKLLRSPKKSENNNEHLYDENDIPHILAHPNEWNSDFVATEQPSLHFIVYVPPRIYSPLYLTNSEGEHHSAYIIPQTGGVFIYNREGKGDETSLTADNMHNIIEIFIAQLRESFGLEPLGDITYIDEKSIEILPSPTGIAEWERDQLVRERTYENLYLAVTDLHSLSELVQKLTIMMISDEIQQIVIDSLNAIKQVSPLLFFFVKILGNINCNMSLKASEALKSREFDEAQIQSRIAMSKAHKAFFDPDMLVCKFNIFQNIYYSNISIFMNIEFVIFS